MDDIRNVVKELHRIADASEKMAKAFENQNRITRSALQIITATGSEEDASDGED